MGQLIMEHEGTLECFIGDGMMVIFNDPVPVPNPQERAVRMALAMRECNERNPANGESSVTNSASASASPKVTRPSVLSASRDAGTTAPSARFVTWLPAYAARRSRGRFCYRNGFSLVSLISLRSNRSVSYH